MQINGGTRRRTPSLLDAGAGPMLFPRRPVLVDVRVLVRERRLRETTLFALFVEEMEFERVTADGIWRGWEGTTGDIDWAMEALDVA